MQQKVVRTIPKGAKFATATTLTDEDGAAFTELFLVYPQSDVGEHQCQFVFSSTDNLGGAGTITIDILGRMNNQTPWVSLAQITQADTWSLYNSRYSFVQKVDPMPNMQIVVSNLTGRTVDAVLHAWAQI